MNTDRWAAFHTVKVLRFVLKPYELRGLHHLVLSKGTPRFYAVKSSRWRHLQVLPLLPPKPCSRPSVTTAWLGCPHPQSQAGFPILRNLPSSLTLCSMTEPQLHQRLSRCQDAPHECFRPSKPASGARLPHSPEFSCQPEMQPRTPQDRSVC